MIEHLMDQLMPIVQKVAGSVAKDYKAYGAGADDLQNECWIWAMEHVDNIEQWIETSDRWEEQVGFSMRNHCRDHGQAMKAQHRGYHRDDLIANAVTILSETMPSTYRDNVASALEDERAEDEANPPASPRERDPHSPLDVRWAYENLGAEDRDLLDAFYRDGCKNKEMAESRAVSEQTMSNMRKRALERLAKEFGDPPQPPHPRGDFEGWQGRRSISTSRARAILDGYSNA